MSFDERPIELDDYVSRDVYIPPVLDRPIELDEVIEPEAEVWKPDYGVPVERPLPPILDALPEAVLPPIVDSPAPDNTAQNEALAAVLAPGRKRRDRIPQSPIAQTVQLAFVPGADAIATREALAAEGAPTQLIWRGSGSMAAAALRRAVFVAGLPESAYPEVPSTLSQASTVLGSLGCGLRSKAQGKGRPSYLQGRWFVGDVIDAATIRVELCDGTLSAVVIDDNTDKWAPVAQDIVARFNARVTGEILSAGQVSAWLGRLCEGDLRGIEKLAGYLLPPASEATVTNLLDALVGEGWKSHAERLTMVSVALLGKVYVTAIESKIEAERATLAEITADGKALTPMAAAGYIERLAAIAQIIEGHSAVIPDEDYRGLRESVEAWLASLLKVAKPDMAESIAARPLELD